MDSNINCFTSTAPLPVCLRIDRPQSKTTLNGMIHKFSDNLVHKCNSEFKKKKLNLWDGAKSFRKAQRSAFYFQNLFFYTLDYL